jgi:hypothetical protein|tara:strand:+ start:461 stop:679 length:219 start_codon:yes stop_codon:yes gene_type:complete
MLKIYAVGLILLTSACATTTTQGGGTEITAVQKATCSEWRKSLPTRSRADTVQTQDEIQIAIAKHDAVCGDT